MSNPIIKQVKPEDEEIIEEWVVESDNNDVWGVYVTKMDDEYEFPWNITIAAAEFIREEPLESKFRDLVEKALSAVTGVDEVIEEDREVWLVDGEPDGKALMEASLSVIKELSSDIEKILS